MIVDHIALQLQILCLKFVFGITWNSILTLVQGSQKSMALVGEGKMHSQRCSYEQLW